MAINNLYAYWKYPKGQTNLPILVVMHGWNGGTEVIAWEQSDRQAALGFFVLVVGMRGRNGAGGTREASGREIYDIYDAIQYVRTNFSGIVSADKIAIVGYSGGGGNALAAACKFPDMFNVVISHFGMSDYGVNNPSGWYYNNGGGYTATIVTAIGDTPANLPKNYAARDATSAIQNYSSGFLYIYQDQADATVPFVHASRIKGALDAAGLTNYSYNLTNIGDNPRWTHGYPILADQPSLIQAETTWAAKIKAQSVWTIPVSGTVAVIGYIVTKRFTIWINANGTAIKGTDAAATVVYDTATDTYTVTPLTTGGVDVTITQGAKTGSATNITGATVITVT